MTGSASERAGTDTLGAVRGSLEHSALSGGGSGAPDQPMPHLVELQSRATRALAKHGEGRAARAVYMGLERHASTLIENDRLRWEEDERS